MSIANPFDLSGKSILVFGASSGIGRAIALACSQMGAKLIISGRNREKLNETFVSLVGTGHQMRSLDLLDLESVYQFASELSPIDGLVHAAGVRQTLPFTFVNQTALSDIS